MLGANDKNAIVDRLMQIVTAESATVRTKNGPVEDEVTADKNSLTAAKALGGFYMKFLKNHNDLDGVRLNVKDQNAILNRLIKILSKQTVIVRTKNGLVADEVTADKNSIAAAKFMIGLQTKYRKRKKEDADIVRLDDKDEKAIVERLMQILSKKSVTVHTKDGPVEDHVIADKNAITSTNLLMTLESGTSPSDAVTSAGTSAGAAGSSASPDGFKIGKSFAHCEPDEAPSDAHFTVQDVIQEAIRSADEGVRRAAEQEPQGNERAKAAI